MREKMKNTLLVTCEGVDLNTISNAEFYIRQPGFFRQYEPTIVSETEILVEIPYKDAMLLKNTSVRLQMAFTDANGAPRATEIEQVSVGELLKEAGYDPS